MSESVAYTQRRRRNEPQRAATSPNSNNNVITLSLTNGDAERDLHAVARGKEQRARVLGGVADDRDDDRGEEGHRHAEL